jgi:hypothetical protein
MPHEAGDQDNAAVTSTPPDPKRFRRGGRDARVFRAALVISIILHLSTFTLFRIVIYFPRQDIDYYQFDIVEATATPPVPTLTTPDPIPGAADQLSLSGLDRSLADEPEGDIAGLSPSLPPIQLPTLEFAELRRFRVRQENLASRKLYDEIFQEDDTDSWERFSEGIAALRGSLRRLTDNQPPNLGGPLQTAPNAPQPAETFRPAQGFQAEIQWEAGAPRRRLLFSPPMDALYDLAGGRLDKPVELVLQINPEGRVTNVWSPSLQNPDLVEELQFTVLSYRFEPMPEGPREETATLIIRTAGEMAL